MDEGRWPRHRRHDATGAHADRARQGAVRGGPPRTSRKSGPVGRQRQRDALHSRSAALPRQRRSPDSRVDATGGDHARRRALHVGRGGGESRRPREQESNLPIAVPEEAGYVIHCVEIAFWFVAHDRTLEEALTYLVQAGGDTDTNAAVA